MKPKARTYVERKNGVFKVSVSTNLISDCCNSKPIPEASGQANICGSCGDYARFWTPVTVRKSKQ